MTHPELFQELLRTLNTYSAYTDNTVTGPQKIALAKACEALYSSMEGNPTLRPSLDINVLLNASQEAQKPRQMVVTPSATEVSHTFNSVDTIRFLNGDIDSATKRIAD